MTCEQTSGTGNFHAVTQFFQFRLQARPLLTLDLDDTVTNRTAHPTQLLEAAGKGLKFCTGEWQTLDQGHTSTLASLGLTRQSDDSITDIRLVWRIPSTDTFGNLA